MKANPANFSPFVDADGGEWIKINVGQFRDTIWRPVEMSLDENDQVSYKIEFLTEKVEAKAFDRMANSIIQSILLTMMEENNGPSA